MTGAESAGLGPVAVRERVGVQYCTKSRKVPRRCLEVQEKGPPDWGARGPTGAEDSTPSQPEPREGDRACRTRIWRVWGTWSLGWAQRGARLQKFECLKMRVGTGWRLSEKERGSGAVEAGILPELLGLLRRRRGGSRGSDRSLVCICDVLHRLRVGFCAEQLWDLAGTKP